MVKDIFRELKEKIMSNEIVKIKLGGEERNSMSCITNRLTE